MGIGLFLLGYFWYIDIIHFEESQIWARGLAQGENLPAVWQAGLRPNLTLLHVGGSDEGFSNHNLHLLDTLFVVRRVFEGRAASPSGEKAQGGDAHQKPCSRKG